MVRRVEEEVALVVVEAGAAWPAWMSEYWRVTPNAIVESQLDSESLGDFAGRVAERLDSLDARGASVRVGVLCVANSVSIQAAVPGSVDPRVWILSGELCHSF